MIPTHSHFTEIYRTLSFATDAKASTETLKSILDAHLVNSKSQDEHAKFLYFLLKTIIVDHPLPWSTRPVVSKGEEIIDAHNRVVLLLPVTRYAKDLVSLAEIVDRDLKSVTGGNGTKPPAYVFTGKPVNPEEGS